MTLRDIVNHPNVTIIDVRESWEYEAGHLENAINIPLATLKANLLMVDEFNKPILLCCETGNRSQQAHNQFIAKGYTQLYDGGSWKDLNNMKF